MIIGLIGAPESGKDAIANFFIEHKSFKRLAFADKIKEGFYAETGYNEEQFKLSRGTPLELQIRNGLWEYSDKICKKFGQGYFVEQVISNINGNVVITDVRTDIELDTLETKCSAKILLVLRDFKKELAGEILPGTKLKLNRIISYSKIWNISRLEDTYTDLYRIFSNL